MTTEDRIREEEMTQRLEEIRNLHEIQMSGETEIDDEVIGSIAGIATREVEGVATLGGTSLRRSLAERVGGGGGRQQRSRGVSVESGRREAVLDLTMTVIYGYSIPEIVVQVRQNVARRVLEMTGLVTKEVNIDITGIEFPERMPGQLQ